MQKIIMYLRADSVNAKTVDSFNQITGSLPALTRGMRALLCLRLLDGEGEPLDNLNYVSWDFVLAHDWDTGTAPQIRVTEGITAVGGEIQIPLTETNTEELIAALGSQPNMTLGAELAGFEAGETTPGFLLQFDLQIRNRRGTAGTGTPEPVADGSYSAPQIQALFRAGFEVEMSIDGENWTAEPEDAQSCRFYRFRNEAMAGNWSNAVPLIVGPRGFRSTVAAGEVSTLEPGAPARVENIGDEHDAVFNFAIPQGEKGDAATLSVGSVTTGAPSTAARVENSGDEHNAVLDFTIPEGEKGETGDASYLYTAYAEDLELRGFSLTPAANLKYRAEIIRRIALDPPKIGDFAEAQWVKYLGDDGVSFGDILVADQSSSVAQVTRIVFENASIRAGDAGEVIVNFHNPGTALETVQAYSLLNGATRLSSWINGGGSSGGSVDAPTVIEPESADSTTTDFSTFKPK